MLLLMNHSSPMTYPAYLVLVSGIVMFAAVVIVVSLLRRR